MNKQVFTAYIAKCGVGYLTWYDVNGMLEYRRAIDEWKVANADGIRELFPHHHADLRTPTIKAVREYLNDMVDQSFFSVELVKCPPIEL